MSVFGTSELAIVKVTPPYGETRYVCDVEKMIDGIRRAYEELFSETARWPCTIHMHPADFQYLRADMGFAETVDDGQSVACFMSMRIYQTSAVAKGFAQLSICPGCQSAFGTCANKQVWK